MRKVSFQQQTVTSTTATDQMSSMQETQVQDHSESAVQPGRQVFQWNSNKTFAELPAAFDVKEGDAFYALATFVSETGEAMNLVEGERVYVLEWNNADWW